jgi:hypothetical protein
MEEETKTIEEIMIEEIMEENQELDSEYIGTQVSNGLTSGILDNPAGYRISWELKVEKFKL